MGLPPIFKQAGFIQAEDQFKEMCRWVQNQKKIQQERVKKQEEQQQQKKILQQSIENPKPLSYPEVQRQIRRKKKQVENQQKHVGIPQKQINQVQTQQLGEA